MNGTLEVNMQDDHKVESGLSSLTTSMSHGRCAASFFFVAAAAAAADGAVDGHSNSNNNNNSIATIITN